MKNNQPLLKVFMLGLLLSPIVICQEHNLTLTEITGLDVTTSAPDVPTVTIATSLPTKVPGIPTTTVTTTDVCGLSLVSPNEESNVKLQKCTCSTQNEDIDCSELDVSSLPKLISFPKSARSVSFFGNNIESIADDTFYSGRNVLELDLSHNRIDFISSVAFKAFKSLRGLDLSHNKIWNMPSRSFQGVTGLRYLNLGYNDIISITSDLFSQAKGIKELILESNPLQELEPKVFEHLPDLKILSLESTLMKVIPDHLFLFTPHLKLLDLSNNQLEEVPTDALNNLDRLEVLELSANPILSIGPQSFLGLRGLSLLYLDRMPHLSKIEKYAFGDLQLLQELHCNYNFMLTELDVNAFVRKIDNKKVPLSQLFLRQNSLEMIPKDLLNWNENVELHIPDNPLACDCHAEWMVNLKLKNEFQTHAKCYSPSHLYDMSLSQLKDHTLSCGMELSEIVMIAIAIVVSVIVLALIVMFLVWRRSFSGYTRPYFKVKRKNVEDIDYKGDDCI